jgi:signal transduction histidine kinase
MASGAGGQRLRIESELIVGSGEMADAVRAFDWSRTPLGPIPQWPPSLITAVNICLNSRFPMLIWWGRELIMLYNDAWRPVLGASKPLALGRPGRAIWPEIWHIIGRQLDSVLETGRATWSDDLLLVLDRNFYTEEAYFTYSYSPIVVEDGSVAGVFSAITETTKRVIGERRLETLRLLGLSAAESKTTEDAYRQSRDALAENPYDIPFALLYAVEADGKSARLVQAVGVERGLPYSPERVSLEHGESVWPLAAVVRSTALEHVADLAARVGELPGGRWPAPAVEAVVLPMTAPGQARLAGLAAIGISPYRKFDEDYRSFLTLAVGHIATAVSNAQAYESERKRAEALAELDRAKTTFFSNVSHELRTPLTLMLGPLEQVMMTPVTTPENRERVIVAHRNCVRLLRLVNTLLDFSRIEAGRLCAQYEPTDLALFTAEIASNFRSACEHAGLDLLVDCRPLPEPVYVDREMWEKIVVNLISNAFKYTFAGSIRVGLSSQDGCAVLEVKDTGTGIPAAELPRLFDRFHRVENARGRTHEGTGIGLALVQELVKAHGGAVSAASELGKGSTFTVQVPFGTGHLPAERVRHTEVSAPAIRSADVYVQEALRWLPEESGGAVVGGIHAIDADDLGPGAEGNDATPRASRVLLAEDNTDMREYLRRLLSPHVQVRVTRNGAEALASALADPPDLVLSDVMMPVMDGFGLLQELRANPLTKTIPIILLSARAGEESRVEGAAAGADDYLVKPFSARELVARVTAHLRIARTRKEAMEAIEHANAELVRANDDLNQFAYSASHDLQEPLRNIAICSQLLENKLAPNADGEIQEFIRHIAEGSARMEVLLRDLLAYARIASEGTAPEPADAADAVRAAADNLKAAIDESGAMVEFPELPTVAVNRSHLQQLFQNLIGNAIKYRKSGEQPEIRIGAVRAGGTWRFKVQDNGIGIAPEYHQRIFGLFKRLHSVEEYPGAGMGLAIAQKIVHRYGGEIWVESAPGEGAAFCFTLPAGD